MFEELTASAGHRLVAALDDIAAGHYPARPETRNLCTMCAFVAVCRHPGGLDDPGPHVTKREGHRGTESSTWLINRASSSTPRQPARHRRRLTRARAGWRSIRSETSPSRRRRAPARRASSSIVTCGCSKPVSRRATSWRSPLRARRRRKCASASCRRSPASPRGEPQRDEVARDPRCAQRHRHQHHRRLLPVAAARIPARGRRRSGFDLADETETPRFIESSLDSALAIGRAISIDDADVALLFTELGEPRLRKALTALLDRRLVASDALNRFLRGREMSIEAACDRLTHALRGAMSSISGGDHAVQAFIASGPVVPGFDLLAREMRELMSERRRRRRACAACSIGCRIWS